MNDIDFLITGINRVIQRKSTPSWHINKPHCEKEYNIVIALEGKARYIINNKEININKNDIVLFSPEITRKGHADKLNPWKFITINFNMEFNKFGENLFKKDYILFENSGAIIRSKFHDIAYIWEGKSLLYSVKCKTILSDILYELIRASMPQNNIPHAERLEAARTYIQANFREKINIEELAKRMELSPSYFRKLFTAAYNQSPKQYITNLRINTAYDLLNSGEVTISEAAFLSGFDDIYYFSTLFKKQTGHTPSKILHSNKSQKENV